MKHYGTELHISTDAHKYWLQSFAYCFSLQIGCRADMAYALVENKLYGWGKNSNNTLGVNTYDYLVLEPMLVKWGGR